MTDLLDLLNFDYQELLTRMIVLSLIVFLAETLIKLIFELIKGFFFRRD